MKAAFLLITLFLYSTPPLCSSLYHKEAHPTHPPMASLQYKGFTLFLVVLVVAPLPQHAAAELQVHTNFSTTNIISNGCNLFQGKWVIDSSYPYYQSSNCPFIDPEFNCIKYGRPDLQYLKFSWKPDSCDLPRYTTHPPTQVFICVCFRTQSSWIFCRFNGLDFLRTWRGKKIMFVGDSLSLNQWQSLACMLHSSVPNSKTTYVRLESLSSVTFPVSIFSLFFKFKLLIPSFLLLFFFIFLHFLAHTELLVLPIVSKVYWIRVVIN